MVKGNETGQGCCYYEEVKTTPGGVGPDDWQKESRKDLPEL